MSRRAVLLLALTATGWAVSAPAASAEVPPATPIRHFVVLMQENHSFDNYFGTYPGADGIPPGACMPIHPSRGRRPCVRPFRLGDRAGPDLPHDGSTHRAQARGGQHGRLHQRRLAGQAAPRVARSWATTTGATCPSTGTSPASTCSSTDGSRPRAAAACPTGWPGWRARPGRERRSSTGSSGAGSRGSSTSRTTTRARGVAPARRPQPARRRCASRSSTCRGSCTGPGCSGTSSTWTSTTTTCVAGRSRRWRTSLPRAAASTRRDGPRPDRRWSGRSSPPWRGARSGRTRRSCGPTTSGAAGTTTCRRRRARGFRVPALLVSPFARQGAVDGTTLEHASIPRFIEHNWGLRPLSRRDARANDITSAFDFAAPARAAEIVPATRARGSGTASRGGGSSTSGTARRSCSRSALIRRAGRRRAAAAPLAALAIVLAPGTGPAPRRRPPTAFPP